jgi:hypothetical protein
MVTYASGQNFIHAMIAMVEMGLWFGVTIAFYRDILDVLSAQLSLVSVFGMVHEWCSMPQAMRDPSKCLSELLGSPETGCDISTRPKGFV